MTPLAFKVAMLNTLELGPYEEPATIVNRIPEWLIVERSGDALQISEGNAMPKVGAEEAPDTLAPVNTLYGVRIDTNVETGTDTFLLVRRLPRDAQATGSFFPADGFARLEGNADPSSLRLVVHGRHFHRTEVRNGQPIQIDVAIPPDASPNGPVPSGGLNWHFDAARLPWAGERIA